MSPEKVAYAAALTEQRTGRRYGIVADPDARVVRLHFGGPPLSWLTLTSAEALQLSAALRRKAGEILEMEQRTGESV